MPVVHLNFKPFRRVIISFVSALLETMTSSQDQLLLMQESSLNYQLYH
jgi:hypothetical protein